MKRFLFLVLMLLNLNPLFAKSKGEKVFVYTTNIECIACQKKLEKNLPFEKGIKSFKIDLHKKTVEIKFVEQKTSAEKLKTVLEKYGTKVISYKELKPAKTIK